MKQIIPEIIFDHSYLYDEVLKKDKYYRLPKNGIFNRKIKLLNKKWNEVGREILSEIEKNTGLKWNDNEIIIYVTKGIIPYSDPITICLSKYTDDMIDKATHELIHAIIFDVKNWSKIKKKWQKLMKHYKNELEMTRVHVPVHSVHKAILIKLFGDKRFKREIKSVTKKEYLRSWYIIERDGYKNIIKKLNASGED